jgi:hypothetical protein
VTIEDELNKIDFSKLIVEREKTAPAEPTEHIAETPAKVAPPSIDQAQLGVDAGAISDNPAEAYRQGFSAGAQVRKATPGAANGVCWSCGRDPHQPSHAEQVEMLRDAMWARQLPIFMWPQEEFDRLLKILDGLGEGAYLAGAKPRGPVYYSEVCVVRADGSVWNMSRRELWK